MPCLAATVEYRTSERKIEKQKEITQKERFKKIVSVIAKLEKQGFDVFASDPILTSYRYLDEVIHNEWDGIRMLWLPLKEPKRIFKTIKTHCIVIEAMPPGHTEKLFCAKCGEKVVLEWPDSAPMNYPEMKESFFKAHIFCTQARRKIRGDIL